MQVVAQLLESGMEWIPHTTSDGDSIYAVSVGTVSADMDLVGTLAAQVMSEAIIRAINSCESAFGFISASSMKQ